MVDLVVNSFTLNLNTDHIFRVPILSEQMWGGGGGGGSTSFYLIRAATKGKIGMR